MLGGFTVLDDVVSLVCAVLCVVGDLLGCVCCVLV